MISESPSKELTDIYSSVSATGSANANGNGRGIENHSPDETTTTSSSKVVETESKGDGGPRLGEVKKQIEGMNPQEKGEKVGSGDGTHTPQSMVYDPSTSTSTSQTNTSNNKEERHHSLLITSEQIPTLQQTFDLRPAEILDITRAIEQADLRAKATDRRSGGK